MQTAIVPVKTVHQKVGIPLTQRLSVLRTTIHESFVQLREFFWWYVNRRDAMDAEKTFSLRSLCLGDSVVQMKGVMHHGDTETQRQTGGNKSVFYVCSSLPRWQRTKTNMLVATNKSSWQPAGCEASFSERSLGKSVYCNSPTCSQPARKSKKP